MTEQITKVTDTSERGFQRFIVKELKELHGFRESVSTDFDREFCINKDQLLEFIQTSQPDTFDFLQKKGVRTFLQRLDKKIRAKGIIECLRKGIKHLDRTIHLFYSQPVSSHNPKDAQRYNANIFSVTQELKYSPKNENRLDLTIFLNGLPIITMELKNGYTRQAVGNAIRQYKNTRSSRDKIFNFGRCLVHFAADTDLVYMTTRLAGKSTFFLPFNRGLNNGAPVPPFGAGNPLNPDGLKTDYLWQEILSKESLSNIIEKYVQIVEEKDEDSKRIKRTLIFPRYHQLTVVRTLLAHAKEHGVGNRYLIQHSAGSGKSYSITWLAHQLVGLHDSSNTKPIFDSIIVVTDRRVLDEQIRENIKSFAQVRKVVEAITGKGGESKTEQLKRALADNKKIIITTVQTFPHVLKAMDDMRDSSFAIIIDEAHSSQSGDTAAKMNAVLASSGADDLPLDEEGNVSTEDLLNHLIESRKMLSNASYFAFTATPKNKTLETFGTRSADGEFQPFHTYSMKQAIEEEFILDVLKNYTTYNSYYKLQKAVEDNPDYETSKAQKKLRAYVEGHEFAIGKKARIMVDHFHREVAGLIGGKAKAMVVTKSIESAMKYKNAIDAYLREINSPYKAIVAFSGSKKHYKTGKELTEAGMNNFPDGDNDIPRQFKKDEYRFLIVANKYQTGFDQPLLHTMYVDKKLADVQAVQTLSRLNRSCKPHKRDTFVLDFYNITDEIELAFKPFYTTTILSRETDANKLNDLQDDLDGAQVYDREEVERFFTLYYRGAERSETDPIIDLAVSVFTTELNQDQQIQFKSKAKAFVRAYGYLGKLLDFNNHYWETLWLFLKLLTPKLTIEDDSPDEDILAAIDMDSYRASFQGQKNIKLPSETGEVQPVFLDGGGGKKEEDYDSLENIISVFNQRFGDIEWTDPDKVNKILVEQIPEELKANADAVATIENSDRQNAKIAMDMKLLEMMKTLMFSHTEVYKKFVDDVDFQNRYQEFIFDIMWQQKGKGSRNGSHP